MGKRAGYKRDKPVYQLRFADEQFDGLEVVAKSLPLGEFFALQRLQADAANDADAAEQVVRKLSDVLVSWNLLDDDDEPVPCEFAVCTVSRKPGNPGQPCSHCQNGPEVVEKPCEYTGLVAQDLAFVLAISQAWMEGVASVPNSSPTSSNDGATSPAPSLPMEPL